jgi:hypothetical protein
MAPRWARPSRTHAIAVLAVLCVALLAWALTLRRRNARLDSDLRTSRSSTRRPAVPRPSGDGPDSLKDENRRLRRELEEAALPQVNLATLVLAPEGPRGPAVLAPDSPALLVLTPPAAGPRPEYRLRVLAHDGTIVWEGSGLRRGSEGTITVVWPAPLARPGEYRLELFGPARMDPRLETFPLAVRK